MNPNFKIQKLGKFLLKQKAAIRELLCKLDHFGKEFPEVALKAFIVLV